MCPSLPVDGANMRIQDSKSLSNRKETVSFEVSQRCVFSAFSYYLEGINFRWKSQYWKGVENGPHWSLKLTVQPGERTPKTVGGRVGVRGEPVVSQGVQIPLEY